MISPLRPIEFVCALMIMSIVRLAIGMVPVTFLAIAFFGFNVYSLGLALAAFFLNLILTSWAVGIVVSGVLLRNGMGAESLAWTLMFVLMPLTCVYYPVSVLPDWLQVIAWTLPPTYVFEGMRALVMEQVFRADLMVEAFALNAIYLAAAVIAFLALLNSLAPVGLVAANRRIGQPPMCFIMAALLRRESHRPRRCLSLPGKLGYRQAKWVMLTV
jgi:ABC-2 type transport system permease protein